MTRLLPTSGPLRYALGPTLANLTLARDIADGQLTSALTTRTELAARVQTVWERLT